VTSLRLQLASEPLLLDGGLSTTLEQLGFDITGDLWSAQLLQDEPLAVERAHRVFFEAGAQVATTASYQATFAGFARHGVDPDTTELLMRRSVALARAAAESVDTPTWVAASAGPYGAMLADGSEYTGRYGLSVDQLREFHRPRLAVLADSGADVVAFETIPCAAEVEAVLLELDGSGVDAWVSVSIDAGRTRAGEPLADVLAMTRGVNEVIAVGVNCSTPSDASAAVPLAAASGHPVVIYPNSGEGWDAAGRAWVPAADGASAAAWPVQQWVDQGARLVGGCCRIGPAQIAAIGSVLHPGG
jgi:homocysteine S-methyltransferase